MHPPFFTQDPHIKDMAMRVMSTHGFVVRFQVCHQYTNAKLFQDWQPHFMASPARQHHIPVMVDLEFNLVQQKPHQGFRWDREAMMRSMNDVSCQAHRQFIECVETDWSESNNQWRGLWDETTTDPMWDSLNQKVSFMICFHSLNILN